LIETNKYFTLRHTNNNLSPSFLQTNTFDDIKLAFKNKFYKTLSAENHHLHFLLNIFNFILLVSEKK